MCGITGYWTRGTHHEPWLRDLGASVESIRQRGPDDQGIWLRDNKDVALGHTRLSILDLSPLGHQPMVSRDGNMVIAFNGEVYNFAEIRTRLQKRGHSFRSSGDTEVVLAALQEWGIAAIDQFIGMFAIALWNEKERRLWLIRDRLGVKPLYYAWNGKALWFGSELKALRAFRAWNAEIDTQSLGDFFQYGYISAPRAIYKQVHKLKPGHWLELTQFGEPQEHCYWSAATPRETFVAPEAELEEQLESLLISAFRYRMVADVPVGVFLSGGVDSSLITALLQRHSGHTVHTFTVGFNDPQFDESSWASRVAAHLGTVHTEQILSPSEMGKSLTQWADLFDEPFGDSSGIPTFLVSRMARDSVKVALSADGGDELFNGYQHYGVLLARNKALSGLPLATRNAIAQALRLIPGDTSDAVLRNLPLPAQWRHGARRILAERVEKLRVILPHVDPWTLYDLAMSFWTVPEINRLVQGYTPARGRIDDEGREFADQMRMCDLNHYLPDDILAKVDRVTMAAGLEGREPLLDHRIAEFAMRLPLHLRRGPLGAKHLLRKILYGYVPKVLIDRPKQGFGVPLSRWLRGPLANLIDTYLAPERIKGAGILDPVIVRRAVDNFRQGGARHDRIDVQKVWLLLAFEMWREKWSTPTQVQDEIGAERYAHLVHY